MTHASDWYWDPQAKIKRWWRGAACQGLPLDLFFNDSDTGPSTLDPLVASMCYDCPVKMECRLVAYAERNGHQANTSRWYRRDNRSRIFGRLLGHLTTGDHNDDWRDFRSVLAGIAKQRGSVLENMREFGFTQDEVDHFAADTADDERALARIMRQESYRTTGGEFRKSVGF